MSSKSTPVAGKSNALEQAIQLGKAGQKLADNLTKVREELSEVAEKIATNKGAKRLKTAWEAYEAAQDELVTQIEYDTATLVTRKLNISTPSAFNTAN